MRRSLSRLAALGSRAHLSTPSEVAPADIQRQLTLADGPPESVQPGQHVISVFKKHNILFSQHMKLLRGLKPKEPPFHFVVNSSQQHCVQRRAMRFFDKLEHPFAASMLEIYIKKNKDPLWMHCSAMGGSAYPNKVASKKIAHAMRDALADAGYDRFGRRVLVGDGKSPIAELYGSLDIMCFDAVGVCNAKFTDLLTAAKKVVAYAEPALRRDKSGHHLPPATPSGAQNAQRREHNNWKGQQGQQGQQGRQGQKRDNNTRHDHKFHRNERQATR